MAKKNTKKSIKKPMAIMIIALVVVFGGIFGYNGLRTYFIKRFFAHYQPPPVTISATKAKSESWQPSFSAVGTLTAVNGVDVTSEVSGLVVQIDFKSGEVVTKGEPLLKLDASVDQQDLKNFKAKSKLAELNYQRQIKLLPKGATTAADVDKTKTELEETQAMVGKTQAIIAHKTIVAPFSGRLGIRMVNLGQYVSPGTALVTLQSLNPLYAQFSLPEQDLNRIYVGQSIKVTVDTFPGRVFPGEITAINSKVDETTRNVLVQATLANPKNLLYPGMYANIEILLPQQERVVTIPQTAISYSLYGDSVFIITQEATDKKGKPILKVKRHYVRLGARRGNQVAVVSGLKPGERIVTSGQLKLQDGVRVVINNNVKLPGVETLPQTNY